MKVRYSDMALAELQDIYRALEQRNPRAAQRFTGRLLEIEKQIELFPYGFQPVPQRRSVRRAPFIKFPYLLLYTVRDGEAFVFRTVHGARDKILEDDL